MQHLLWFADWSTLSYSQIKCSIEPAGHFFVSHTRPLLLNHGSLSECMMMYFLIPW